MSVASSQVDEAYKRLGKRLSLRAHGDGPAVPPRRVSNMGLTPSSTFAQFGERQSADDPRYGVGGVLGSNGLATIDRTTKVAKKRYSDHGDHQHHKTTPRHGNVLRKMTIKATELFRIWESDTMRRNKKRSSPKGDTKPHGKMEKRTSQSDLSPHRFAFSQLALEGSELLPGPHDHLPPNLLGMTTEPNLHGLSAVIESNSSRTSQSNTPLSNQGSMRSRESSLASKSEAPSMRSLPRGKCLVQPSESVSNNGLDNSEGNLIVYENDAISVSRKQIHALTKEKMNVQRADFRVQSLLGQGTFAQVFQCVHVQTGNLVAIKVVKNKPAYTRQAAVEIDVFRVLVKGGSEKVPSSSKSGRMSTSPNSTVDQASVRSMAGESKFDHMVDLICYFMHQNHLCLVFELLGLNLYEILKKRQFRGLPLSVVRVLVKQAVTGTKELAKKNIVHCDLKPENILLVSEDDADSVVSAGESRRSSRSNLSLLEKSSNDHATSNEPPTNTAGGEKTRAGTPITSDAMSRSPANSLGTTGTMMTNDHSLVGQKIKLIDFGSACFEGQSTHTYIQSRFYRSPEVLLGLPYDSAIDMWSLGCVAAELFLGLPILPGVHEHDQLARICEMISSPSAWMLEQGSKGSKFFVKFIPPTNDLPPPPSFSNQSMAKALPQWRIRTQQEYIETLSQNEIQKKGGLSKLKKQPANRYFKKKHLSDIISHKGQTGSPENKENLELFIHFLYGILDPDPWRRWTALQASQHPFLTGVSFKRKSQQSVALPATKDENQANVMCDISWDAPIDPNICRRKLLSVQKTREKQQSRRAGQSRGGVQQFPPPTNPNKVPNQSKDFSAVRRHQIQNGNETGSRQAFGMKLSSSYTDNPNGGVPSDRFSSDTRSLAQGQTNYFSGPLSYTETGHQTGAFPNSFNEVDFAYALQRPGVVPMGGESIASSVDLSSVGMSQKSYNANGLGNIRNQLNSRQNSVGIASRSYNETLDNIYDGRHHAHGPGPGSVGTAPGGLYQQMGPPAQVSTYPSSSVSLNQGAFSYNSARQDGTSQSAALRQAQLLHTLDQTSVRTQASDDPTSVANSLHQQLVYDNAQVYLQQQHVALQQQQLMLQQQQAALAMRQQQLQARGMNPNMGDVVNQNLGGGMNQMAQPSEGYYYVTAADGTQMIVPAAGLDYNSPHYSASHQGGIDPRMLHQNQNGYHHSGI